MSDTASLQQLKLGYADRTLGLRLPHSKCVDGAILRQRLEAAGIILCNEPLDALIFWAYGFRSVTFNHRGEGLTGELCSFLASLCKGQSRTTKNGCRLCLAYRNSETDDIYAQRDAAQLHALGMDVYRCLWARDMPLGQYIRHKRDNAVPIEHHQAGRKSSKRSHRMVLRRVRRETQ